MKPFEQRGQAIIKRLPQNAIMAEVGVLRGLLSEYILSRRPDVQLFMVDSWATTDKQPERYRATGDDHALHADPSRVASHKAEAERRVHRLKGRAHIMPMLSADAARLIDDGALHLVFLDADHSKEGVAEDIAAWLPKVKAGGWLSGHDYANSDPRFRFGVTEAVDEWASATGRAIEVDANYTWFARV